MTYKVIDVSNYQGTVDWRKVKAAGIEGAVLKVMNKDLNPDKQFENNWRGCEAAGVRIVGVYNYSYATTEERAAADAQKVTAILQGRKVKVWLDVEDDSQKKLGLKLIHIIKAYRKVIEAAGLEFGVYTGLSFYNSYIRPYHSMLDCKFWIARYPSALSMPVSKEPEGSKKPSILHPLEGWQYSSRGSVPGIRGSVDLSLWYVELASTVYGGLDYAPVFDAVYYADRYKDLKDAYGNDAAALFTHFITYGMREGRQAIDTFNVQAYKSRYPDLQKAFGENLPLYYQHYVQHGREEKRIAL